MTPTTDTTEHPDVTELSDLTEGLLPPSRTAEVQSHLDGCELCADVHGSLAEIQDLLGTLPVPTHMPANVAQRIDAALAAEARVSRETSAEADHANSMDHPTDRPAERPTDRPAGRSSAATGPGRKERRPLGRRRKVILGAVLTAALLGGGSVLVSTLVGHDSTSTTTAAGTFAKEHLKSQVTELLAKKQGTGRGSDTQKPWGIQSQTDRPQTMIQPSAAIPGCVRAGIHRGTADVLGAKKGTYDGREAYLVVLPAASDDTKVTAYVVDASCHEQTPGKVLLTESYDRP
ncbi:anti-sigma factor family protein [Streptomyces sp. YIM S03343]